MKLQRRRGLAVSAGLLLGGWSWSGLGRAQAPMVKLPHLEHLVAAEVGAILQRGELVVAMAARDDPPFFYLKDQRLVGSDVRMAEQLAEELRVALRVDRSARTFNEVVGYVARGEADLGISKLSHTLSRALSVHFSSPYLTLNHALLLNRIELARLIRNQSLATVIRNFNGSLGVIAESAFADFAPRNFPKARIVSYPNWRGVIDAVRRGEITGAYRDEFEIRRALQSDPGLVLTLRTVVLKDLVDAIAIAVGVHNPTLLAFVNKFIDQRVDKLTVDEALKELR